MDGRRREFRRLAKRRKEQSTNATTKATWVVYMRPVPHPLEAVVVDVRLIDVTDADGVFTAIGTDRTSHPRDVEKTSYTRRSTRPHTMNETILILSCAKLFCAERKRRANRGYNANCGQLYVYRRFRR